MSENLYYSPDQSGLEIIDLIEMPRDYSFHMLVSWLHKASGRVFYGEDSGCSCPSPFENDYFRGPDDTSLTELTNSPNSKEAFVRQVDGFDVSRDERNQFGNKTLTAMITSASAVPTFNSGI